MSIEVVREVLSKEGMDIVDVKSAVTQMLDMITNSMLGYEKHIKVNLTCASFTLVSRQATSLILIINELLHNALEHAFIYRDFDTVNISVSQQNNEILFVAEDDGVGCSKEDLNKTNSLGLNIIKTLVEKDHKGIINLAKSDGTRVKVKFPFLFTEEV